MTLAPKSQRRSLSPPYLTTQPECSCNRCVGNCRIIPCQCCCSALSVPAVEGGQSGGGHPLHPSQTGKSPHPHTHTRTLNIPLLLV